MNCITEFFKQVFKVELLNTKQGHKDKGLGLCSSKGSVPSKALFFNRKMLQGIAIS